MDLWRFACITGASEALRDKTLRALEDRRRWAVEDRIRKVRPIRREAPLREANITDREIEQITAAGRHLLPGAIVNIGSVVTGCPCEDGPLCTDQVWIVVYRPDQSIGRLLSRIGGSWQIGRVQQWYLDYEEVATGRSRLPREQQDAIIDGFPACTAPP